MMVISQSYDGEQIVVRCPSSDNFSLYKITKRQRDLQAFTQLNYVIDFAFRALYLCGANSEKPLLLAIGNWLLALNSKHYTLNKCTYRGIL